VSTWALRSDLDLEGLNAHLDALEAAGLLGIVEEGGVATAYFPARVDGLPVGGRWEPVPDLDWEAHWRRHARVVRVGPVVVAPPWLAEETGHATPAVSEGAARAQVRGSPVRPAVSEGAARAQVRGSPIAVVIEPGQAFGTGDHETTAGCLAALCELGVAGRRVLDVGTGTGVLAIVAARLGAAALVAVDLDPLAVAAARANAAVNRVDVEVREGTAGAVTGTFDVVVANLDTDTLRALAPALVGRLAPGGTLIASGVSVERAGEACAAFARVGLRVLDRPGREWVVLTGRRS
jgi:ribosomal protein L11 methyltransferase